MNVMRRMPRGRDSEVVEKSPTQMRIRREGGLKSYKSKARNFSASLPKLNCQHLQQHLPWCFQLSEWVTDTATVLEVESVLGRTVLSVEITGLHAY